MRVYEFYHFFIKKMKIVWNSYKRVLKNASKRMTFKRIKAQTHFSARKNAYRLSNIDLNYDI